MSPSSQAPASHKIKRLPLQDLGLTNLVAIPYVLSLFEPLQTILRIGTKQVEILPVTQACSNTYTIGGVTATGYEFMFGKKPSPFISRAVSLLRHALEHDPEGTLTSIGRPDSVSANVAKLPASEDPSSLTTLSLESPEQFAMAWTKYAGLYDHAAHYLPTFVKSLTDAGEATKQFWPTLANYSFGNNLIVLEKIRDNKADEVKSRFADAWAGEGMQAAYEAGRLYALDMTIFDSLASPEDNPSGRYTHATYTVLRQDAQTKTLEPVAIWISGKNFDGRPRIYTGTKASPGAWLYALQAAKVCLAVYAIFLRHVYLWHVLPATLQMTMHNTMAPSHPVYQLLAPQSKRTMAYDEVMLLLWNAAKPSSSLSSPFEFLRLSNEFAKDRGFFDDDPKVALGKLGLREEDFTQTAPWDGYAAVRDLLELWAPTEQYVDACVDASYPDDASVANDATLKAWMAASADPEQGNIHGLEALDGRAALKRLLTSLLFKVLAHGGANMPFSTVLVHLFASNFPLCLQRRDIPEPDAAIDTKQLLTYLPNTQTIGLTASFYFQFVFTGPTEPFIPRGGVEADLFFPSGMSDPRNQALVAYRNAVVQFIKAREVLPGYLHQWPLNVEQ